MNTETFFDKIGEAVVMVWSDGLECREWGVARVLRRPVGRVFLGLAGVFFRLSDDIRIEKSPS